MSGRIVLVTGASGGIAGTAARAFLAAGDTVVGADLRPPVDDPGFADFRELDVTSEAQCIDVVRGTAERFGGIDVLVNAAGILGATPDPLRTSTAEFEQVMRIHAAGTFSMARETAKVMLEADRGGTMLLVSSVAAKESRKDYLPYNAAKLAILHIVWSFAELLGPSGISVNAVTPGPVETDMWAQKARDSGDAAAAQAARAARALELPMRRFAQPAEVVSAIMFLTDPANRYLTGVSLDVAGGAHLGMGT